MTRIIFHCDLDCFFAAVEERNNPEYQGKPVIIGADPKDGKGRGVVSTCNYEARKFGLHSAMPISKAFSRCPHGIYLRPNFEKYHQASKEVMEIVNSYSDKFQKVSVDEAYLDITDKCFNFKEVKELAELIKDEVHKKVGITISIGCAPTKTIAKIASDFNKPNGITIVEELQIKDFLKDLDITWIPGIGKKSKVYYYKKGIKTIGDIFNL
jgi:DNA polymerase IV (DinB-like DNA polymerase)